MGAPGTNVRMSAIRLWRATCAAILTDRLQPSRKQFLSDSEGGLHNRRNRKAMPEVRNAMPEVRNANGQPGEHQRTAVRRVRP